MRAHEVEQPAIETEAEAAALTPGATRFRMSGDGTVDDCISVRGEGFPAIDRTNQLVAVSDREQHVWKAG